MQRVSVCLLSGKPTGEFCAQQVFPLHIALSAADGAGSRLLAASFIHSLPETGLVLCGVAVQFADLDAALAG